MKNISIWIGKNQNAFQNFSSSAFEFGNYMATKSNSNALKISVNFLEM